MPAGRFVFRAMLLPRWGKAIAYRENPIAILRHPGLDPGCRCRSLVIHRTPQEEEAGSRLKAGTTTLLSAIALPSMGGSDERVAGQSQPYSSSNTTDRVTATFCSPGRTAVSAAFSARAIAITGIGAGKLPAPSLIETIRLTRSPVAFA